jgi:phytoene dehydrogenase-like protein
LATHYDVVIIGGGVAGLATGALLAKAGRKVVVLEKGNQVGGRAYTYVDRGFVLNYGAHAMYRPHSGLLAQVLKRLERPPIAAPYPNPRTSYFALDGRWGTLGPMPQDVLTTSLLPFASRLRLLPFIMSLRFGDPAQVGDLTLAEWLEERTSDPYLRRLILALATLNTYTHPASELSAQFVLRHFQRNLFARDYVGYMSRGWSTMYETFASALCEHGGEVATGAKVERLVVLGSRVVAVIAGGARYEADAFVLTVPPQQAPKLAEAGSPLRQELERWRGLQDARAFCIDLGFSARLRTDVTFIYDVQYDLYFSLHSEVTPDLAPEGGQLLHAMAYLSPEEAVDAWLNERRHRELEQGLDRHFSGWRDAAVVQRTLPSAQVTVARQTPDQQGPARVPVRSASAENLYFAGDGRDLSYNLTETSLASALEVADLIGREAPAREREQAATSA